MDKPSIDGFFRFKIGEIVTHAARDPNAKPGLQGLSWSNGMQPNFIVARVVEECPGGCQAKYYVRAVFPDGGYSKELLVLHESEAAPFSWPEPKK